MLKSGLVAAALLVLAPTALAQQQPATAPAACAAKDTALTAELKPWTTRTPVKAAASNGDIKAANLKVGQAYAATLAATPDVKYAATPEKPGGSVSKGGMFGLTVKEAGTYGVALGAGAWVDVLKDGKPLQSGAFGHGPECSTIRKIVNFDLTPGEYVVQISANADAELAMMVVKRS
jgi:hypothetical protein